MRIATLKEAGLPMDIIKMVENLVVCKRCGRALTIDDNYGGCKRCRIREYMGVVLGRSVVFTHRQRIISKCVPCASLVCRARSTCSVDVLGLRHILSCAATLYLCDRRDDEHSDGVVAFIRRMSRAWVVKESTMFVDGEERTIIESYPDVVGRLLV